MKLNKTRQQMYLDGKVGLINDGTVEQLREVTRRLRRALERQLHETWLETMRRERGHDGGGAGE